MEELKVTLYLIGMGNQGYTTCSIDQHEASNLMDAWTSGHADYQTTGGLLLDFDNVYKITFEAVFPA